MGEFKKMKKNRIKGLNRRIFRANLKRALKKELFYTVEGSALENWVDDYAKRLAEGCTALGWYEVSRTEHKEGRAEEVRTN